MCRRLITRMIKSTGNNYSSGVTLSELIIVIAIVGILVSVGYPSYIRSKMESRRAEATGTLIATQGLVERYLVENNQPTFGSTDLALARFANYSTSSGSPKLTTNGYYVITIVTDSTGYTINATATATGALNDCSSSGNANTKQCRDTLCRVISINHGVRESTDSSGVVADDQSTKCW